MRQCDVCPVNHLEQPTTQLHNTTPHHTQVESLLKAVRASGAELSKPQESRLRARSLLRIAASLTMEDNRRKRGAKHNMFMFGVKAAQEDKSKRKAWLTRQGKERMSARAICFAR